jgi:hypothetical protein
MAETLLSPSGIKLFGRVLLQLRLLHSDEYQAYLNDYSAGRKGAAAAAYAAGAAAAPPMAVNAAVNAAQNFANRQADVQRVGALDFATAAEYLKPYADKTQSSAKQTRDLIDAAKLIADIPRAFNPVQLGANRFLNQQLQDPASRFARIYAFACEGIFYNLPRPALFLVHGPGSPSDYGDPPTEHTSLETAGVIAKEWEFSALSGHKDLRRWEYDKGDFSIRLDIEAGTFEDVLLAAVMRGGSSLPADRNLSMIHALPTGSIDPRNRR